MAKQVGKKFPWVIKDFSSLKCEKNSDPVLIGDCKWRVSAYPQQKAHRWFDENHTGYLFHSTIPLAKLHDEKEGYIVNGELLIVAEVESGSSVSKRNQDIAVEFRVMNKEMKKSGMNVLLSLTQMLCLTPEELSIDDLVEAENAVAYMKSSGVTVEWLEKKLEEIKQKKE